MIKSILNNKLYLFFGLVLFLLWGALHLSQHKLEHTKIKLEEISNQLAIEKQNNNILVNQLKLEKEKVLVMTEYTKEQEKKLNEDEQTIKTALKTSDCSRVNLPLNVIERLQ